ncbi:MAG: biopolymer transporter ExbD [Brumimicrobium sp.]|nr:biopolymer transporter ExbD [Brumimicrobium sp.]
MAKRQAPEINAGSMADIAFLLLIFFLVTTTMDKDLAYIRTIPKKIVQQEPVVVQPKNIYKISINSKQQIQARDSIIKPEDIESLNGRIKHFYLVNRDKKEDRALNYPYYAFGTKAMFQQRLKEAYDRIEIYEKQPEMTERIEKMIEQTTNEINEWNKKIELIELYTKFSGKREMPEIALQAHVRLESFIKTDYSAYVAVQSEVEKAVTELRNKEAKELFNISYSEMRQYYQQNLLEDTPKVREYKKYMELIESLFPLKIIEVKPTR